MTTIARLLVAATALAAVAVAPLPAGAAAAAPSDRVAVVTLDGGRATVYSGDGAGLHRSRTFRGAEGAVLSPDAQLVAYTRRAGAMVEIRVVRLAGGFDRRLARVTPFDVALAFSPDSARLAYSSAAGIATVRVTGAERRQLPLPVAWRGSRYPQLAFAPDGRRLLVSRTTGDGRAGTLENELAVVELSSGRGSTLLRSENAYDQQARPASFTPDGAHVAVDGTRGIRIVPTAPAVDRQLTTPSRNVYDHSPLVSPDGRYVAFARSPSRGVSDVYVVGFDGTGLRRMTTTPIPPRGTPKVGSLPLAWSPDGSKLLTFRHDRFAVVDVATRASAELRKVGVRYAISSARWFGAAPEPPRAGTIVFARAGESASDLYTIAADGTRLRRLTSNGLSYDPAWSPGGDRIAFTGGHHLQRQLHVMNADGSAALQLTAFGPSFGVWEPSWYRGGATGLRILFTLYTTSGSDLHGIGSDGRTAMPIVETPAPELNGSFSTGGALAYESASGIWIRENGVSRLVGAGTEPQWSPDGRRLAFLRGSGLHGGVVSVIGADGTGYRQLAWGSSPSWSPDGSAIVYATKDGLFTVRADGAGLPRRLTRTPRLVRDSSPSWTAAG